MKVNVLGTEYEIVYLDEKEDKKLKTLDGYCDQTTKKIVIAKLKEEENSVGNLNKCYEHILKHELVHAFMIESGLDNECDWHCEECVDWVAYQLEKILKAYNEIKEQ